MSTNVSMIGNAVGVACDHDVVMAALWSSGVWHIVMVDEDLCKASDIHALNWLTYFKTHK